MDAWNPYYARQDRPSAVDSWASLEAKSETMRDDLIRSHTETTARSTRRPLPLALLGELILAAIRAVPHFHSR